MADALLRATGCDAQRRNSKSSAGYNDAEPHLFLQIWPFRIQIWTEGVLVEHRAPVVGRCNVCPVSFKNRLDTTRPFTPLKGVLTCPVPLSRHDNPDRAGEPRLLVHVGAAHAGRPGRAGSPIQSARAGNLEKRAPGPERSHGACRSPPGRQHQAAPVVARGSAEAGRPSPRRLGADGRSRRTGRALAPGGGTSGLAQRPRADSRSAGPLAAGAGLGETRADPPVHSLRTALGSDRPWAVQR